MPAFTSNLLPLILSLLLLTEPPPCLASPPSPLVAGAAILREELNRINGVNFTTGTFMYRWMERTKKELSLCQNPVGANPDSGLKCLKGRLRDIIEYAFSVKSITSIEHAQLRDLIRKLTLQDDGKLGFRPIHPSLPERLLARSGKRTLVPVLSGYEAKANHFRRLRAANGKAEALDPEVLALLKKVYHRRIITLGRVTPDQYLLAKYSLTQINLMSELLSETMRWMDNRALGQILLDSSGTEAKKEKISRLQDEYIRAATRGAPATELGPLSHEIATLKNELSAQDTLTRILNLREDRYRVAKTLAESTDSGESNALRARLLESDQELEALNEQLEAERVTLSLSVGDLHRLALNHLETRIEALRRRPGALERFNGNLADLLVAGYLTGALDGAELKATLSIPDFVEHYESFLRKSGNLLWRAGRMYLMLNPYTVIPTTMISVVASALQQKKEYERAAAKKSYLIRQ